MTFAAKRALPTIAALFLVLSAGLGCAPVTRYRVLSFFFDGVPPPQGAVAPQTTGGKTVPPARKTVISRHAPYDKKQCNGCHTPMTNNLIAPVPDLCFVCHKMRIKESRHVHAPSLAGFCRLCHDPHMSSHPYLLLAEPRKMCFYCHNPEDIAKNPVHVDDQAPCTQCHNPHADNRFFLREPAGPSPASLPVPVPPPGAPPPVGK